MIKNDVLVELDECSFWFSDFKWMLLQEEDIKLMLNNDTWFELKPESNELIKSFVEYQVIIKEAYAEYEKRNREYVIAMDNGGVLPIKGMDSKIVEELNKVKPISLIVGDTIYYRDGTIEKRSNDEVITN